MFGPNQVGELIIGTAVATETTAQTFIATASDKEVKVLSEDGTAPALGKPFKVLQKTAGDAGKGLNYEFSDVINPKYLERITVANYAAEVQKSVTIGGFTGNVLANHTYEVEIRLYNDGGSLSPENFAIIQGFYVTGASVASETATTIRDGVLASLNKNLIKRGNSEFVTSATGGGTPTITIVGKVQSVVPGKIIGKQIEFDAKGKLFQNIQDLTQPQQNLGLLTTTVNATAKPGVGTGKLAVNYEWFVKGMKYDPARQVGYPVDFNTPYYADIAGQYDVVDFTYYSPRKETSVERQYKTLRVMITTGGAVDDIVTDLETITGLTLNNPGTNLV